MTQQLTISPPIACTLGAGDFKARMAWIADLNARALQTHRRKGLDLVLTYRAEAREDVLSMVRGEQACCAFLTFEVWEEPGIVKVRISAPPAARESAEAVFAPFVSSAPIEAPRGDCCGTSGPTDRLPAARPFAKSPIVGAAAALAATGALACAACCVVPFALPAAALAMSGGVLAWFSGLTPWITAIALLAVGGGWIWLAMATLRSGRRPSWPTLIALGWATLMLAGALAWGQIEDPVRHALGR